MHIFGFIIALLGFVAIGMAVKAPDVQTFVFRFVLAAVFLFGGITLYNW